MAEQQTSNTTKITFDLKDHVETATDASNRSRYLYVILLITTILIFIGLWNSYFNSWMVGDLRYAYKPDNDKAIQHLLHISDEELPSYLKERCSEVKQCFDCCASPAQLAFRDFRQSLMRTHTENRITLRIPILGTPLHINDLGALGGVTLIVLLLLMRTSLSREIKNLGYSFKHALAHKQLDNFYDALARRQLFTIPHMTGERRNRYLSKSPDVVFLLAATVYLMQAVYDAFTYFKYTRYNFELSEIFRLYNLPVTLLTICTELIFALVIIALAGRCMERHYYIYRLWDYYWNLLSLEDYICLLEPEVASRYKTDDAVNGALGRIAIASDAAASTTGVLKFYQNVKVKLRQIYKEEVKPISEVVIPRERDGARLARLKPEIAKKFSDDKEINALLLNPPDEQLGDKTE